MKPLRERIRNPINLYDATPHGFRHTRMRISMETGIDPNTMQTIAGRVNKETTLEVYAHVRQKNVEEAGKKISLAMGQK